MTCIILQSRLDSTRLPRKALLDIGGKPVIVRVMENLRQIPADAYVLACDTDSQPVFEPLAASCGFTCIGGPKDDVLERFCMVVRRIGAETVLRATGDNPFLFADAAEASLRRFAELSRSAVPADYFTFSGLPHGSGIEVFSARRLLEAASLTDSPYDHEHVGPAFYNHTDRFSCVREPAPAAWYHPAMRTTIDTAEDYERSGLMAEFLAAKKNTLPASTISVIEAWKYVTRLLVFIPSVAKGQGTGHLRRLTALAERLQDTWRCILYIPHSTEYCALLPPGNRVTVVTELPSAAHLIIIDRFRSTAGEIENYRKIGPVVAIDEGGGGRALADYLLDIIPALPGRLCRANRVSPSFLPLPEIRRLVHSPQIQSALVVAGGENASSLAMPWARLLSSFDVDVTVIDPSAQERRKENPRLAVTGSVPNLREELYRYDLVLTHYGFTAFEALAAGCRVILFSPTRYHYRLGKAHGFSVLSPGTPSRKGLVKFLKKGPAVPSLITPETAAGDLSSEIANLASRSSRSCPLCGNGDSSRIIARYPDRTVTICPECGMTYLSFLIAGEQQYSRSYFFDEYRSQYGKTYLEDFDSIRQKGEERLTVLGKIQSRVFGAQPDSGKKLLDIGCAYGPFLAAARDAHWVVEGTDISEDAVRYVRDTLNIPAVVSAFPAPDRADSLAKHSFTAVTLWYVIEHFEDLEPVLGRVRDLLVAGGILAFSTPSCAGLSGRFNADSFYGNSPRDHFTLWDPRTVGGQLARYGFSVKKIVSTGHHAERFPLLKNIIPGSIGWKLANVLSRLFRLGDTFEVYAVKNGSTEDME